MNAITDNGFEECRWVVNGLGVAALAHGPADGVPILALHGWLDNAASFSRLAECMPGARLVALDMPGHGLSDHRSVDAGYQIWDDLPQLQGVLDQLGWEKCVMLGHSRGAMIAALTAATLPERVSALVTLDGLLPYPVEDASMISQLRSHLSDLKKLANKPVRVFASREEFVSRRARGGEPETIARQLATRNLRPVDGGYEWRGDPRLSAASAIKLNKGQCEAMLKALTMPVLNIWATHNERLKKLMEAARVSAQQHVADLTSIDIPGHHHWHMEAETAQEIARVIEGFLKSSYH
ncbi:MAG: alpha/beta hydrolase [Nitratireductor sp.]